MLRLTEWSGPAPVSVMSTALFDSMNDSGGERECNTSAGCDHR